MTEGNAPFCGGSGPTWNDAMMAREILRCQADNPNYIPAPSGAGHPRILRAMVYLTLAVLITYYTLTDPAIGGHLPQALAVAGIFLWRACRNSRRR